MLRQSPCRKGVKIVKNGILCEKFIRKSVMPINQVGKNLIYEVREQAKMEKDKTNLLYENGQPATIFATRRSLSNSFSFLQIYIGTNHPWSRTHDLQKKNIINL